MIIASALFTFTTLVQAAFLIYARRHDHYPNSYRQSLWRRHFLVSGTLWSLLAVWLLILQLITPASISYGRPVRLLGLILVIAGFVLVAKSLSSLGLNQAMGLRFFFPKQASYIKHGLYRFLNNPMYDGFILILVGLGLSLGIIENFYLALASFLLLNVFLGAIENYRWSWNFF